jgi:hypothetical protein
MSLFDRFKHGVDVTKFKADQLIRINRVQSEIDDIRRQISDVRVQIASTALDLHKQGTLSNEELRNLCINIDDLKRQIENKEILISDIRAEGIPIGPTTSYQPVNPCPNCYYDVPFGAAFCTNCGNQMPQEIPENVQQGGQQENLCPNCKATLKNGANFCTECGYKLPESIINQKED